MTQQAAVEKCHLQNGSHFASELMCCHFKVWVQNYHMSIANELNIEQGWHSVSDLCWAIQHTVLGDYYTVRLLSFIQFSPKSSQQTPHNLPSQASYGMSFMSLKSVLYSASETDCSTAHRNGKVVRVTALVFTGDAEACQQCLQWVSGLSSRCLFHFSVYNIMLDCIITASDCICAETEYTAIGAFIMAQIYLLS